MILIVVLVVALAVVGFFVFRGDGLSGLNGDVENAAMVNGVAISKTIYDNQLALTLSSFKSQGMDVENADNLAQIKTRVLDDLINNELVNQGIASAGIKTNEEDVNKQVEAVIEQAGGTEKYQQELTKANLTEKQFKENISKQLALQAYLTANVDVSGITVGDDEISQFYKEYSDAQKTASSTIEIPALKDVSDQIKQQISADKQQTLINEFLKSLRDKATIEIFI